MSKMDVKSYCLEKWIQDFPDIWKILSSEPTEEDARKKLLSGINSLDYHTYSQNIDDEYLALELTTIPLFVLAA